MPPWAPAHACPYSSLNSFPVTRNSGSLHGSALKVTGRGSIAGSRIQIFDALLSCKSCTPITAAPSYCLKTALDEILCPRELPPHPHDRALIHCSRNHNTSKNDSSSHSV